MDLNHELTQNNEEMNSSTAFSAFLDNLKLKMHQVFDKLNDVDPFTTRRGVPDAVLTEVMTLHPLSVMIPKEFGGMGLGMTENLAVLSAAGYESAAFTLTLGINSALFLQPLIKFGNSELKNNILPGFTNDVKMGGLMITEPDFGSDALNMQTYFTMQHDSYQLKGTKHWAGLTGFANYWLLTAREKHEAGHLMRDISFFVCDVSKPEQQIVVEEKFDNLGLHHIPYGRNRIDVQIPKLQRLTPTSTGINILLDTLHRSRFQFPSMALGFIQRMMDEAIQHCKQRTVGGKSLLQYDQVQYRLAKLQSSYTICSAMCAYSSVHAGLERDLALCGFEANVFKTLVTDMMQDAAQSLVQLVGAKAFRFSHIGGRGIADSRPFQIFEGSNDMLYSQISEAVMKLMKQAKLSNLFDFFKVYKFTKDAVTDLKAMLNFDLNMQISQRNMVELGKAISRIVSIQMLIELGEKGFRLDLISNAISILSVEISGLMGEFNNSDQSQVIEDYQVNSSWIR